MVAGWVVVGVLAAGSTGGAAAPTDAVARPASPAEVRPRAGVIALTDDRKSSDLQALLESAVGTVPTVALRTASELALSLPVTDSGLADTTAPTKASERIAATRAAFYEDRLAEALESVSVALSILDDLPSVPTAERIRALLWRAAIYQALNDAKAPSQAAAALALDPGLSVDLAVFPPSVHQLVESARAAGLPSAKVAIQTTPRNATILIDDRPGAPRMTLPKGRHRVSVTAPGFRRVDRLVDVEGDLSVSVRLPIALPPDRERTARAIAWRATPATSDAGALASLADLLGVDVLVIAAERDSPPEVRAVVWTRTTPDAIAMGPTLPSIPEGHTALGRWVRTRLPPRSGNASARADAAAPARPDVPLAWAVDGAALGLTRTRAIASEGRTYRFGFFGSGPVIRAEVRRNRTVADVEASVLSFGRSTEPLPLPGAESARLDGGRTIGARIAVGRRSAVTSAGSSWTLGAALWGERTNAVDLRFDGSDVGLFPSSDRVALELFAAGERPLAVATHVCSIRAALGVSPFGVWRERPAGTTGDRPAAAGARWELGVGLPLGAAWEVGIRYAGDWTWVRFEGTADALVAPAVRDAQLLENRQGIAASVRRAF